VRTWRKNNVDSVVAPPSDPAATIRRQGIRMVQLWLQLASIQARPRESATMRAPLVTCGDALLRTPAYTPGATR